MSLSGRIVMTAAVLTVVTPLAARAQKDVKPTLQIGKWTGTITPPTDMATATTYEVATKNDTLTITIENQHGSFPAADITVTEDKLSFSFSPFPGPPIQCALTRKADRSYEGTCGSENGPPAIMTMIPPKPAPLSFATGPIRPRVASNVSS